MRFILLSCTAALAAAPAFAADLGTYRPGVPYHSVIVPTASVCESQCDGDAQCRGWNYVKAAPQAPGVCEFQSSINTPIASAISISGVSNTAMPMSSRVIVGNTNTTRVGTAVTPQPATTNQTSNGRQIPSGRQIIRQPVSGQYSGAYSAPQPGLRPALDGFATPTPQMTQPTLSRGPARQSPQMRNMRHVSPQNAYQPAYGQPQYTQSYQAPSRQAQPHQTPMSQAPISHTPAYQGRPPVGQPIAPEPKFQTQGQVQGPAQGQYMRPPQNSHLIPAQAQTRLYRLPQANIQAPAQPMPRSSASNPVSWESVRAPQQPQIQAQPQIQQAQPRPQQSLYGQLNDDMRQSAPMPTVRSYPSQPVMQMPLAGAQPR